MVKLFPSAPGPGTGAIAWDSSDLFLLLRRNKKIARISAATPSTPRDIPSPMPTFTAVDIPLSVELLPSAGFVEGGCWFGEVEAEDWDGPVVGLAGELCDVGEVARATLNPTIAMAPTLDEVDNVVVAIDQRVEAPAEVKA